MITGSCHCKKLKWTFQSTLESVTACNCTVCSRYGSLWAYGYENVDIQTSGESEKYQRGSKQISFHFCSTCACIAFWRANVLDQEGKRRIAVNIRLADEPQQCSHLAIDHFDGLDEFVDLPRDGKCVKDLWF